MVYSPELLDLLQAIDPAPWTGQAFRHMFGDHPPDAENTRGARWNPLGVAAIYTSLTRGGALAEAEHQIAIQPIRPRARRTVYTLEITLASVLDLTDPALLQNLGVGPAELAADDMIAPPTRRRSPLARARRPASAIGAQQRHESRDLSRHAITQRPL